MSKFFDIYCQGGVFGAFYGPLGNIIPSNYYNKQVWYKQGRLQFDYQFDSAEHAYQSAKFDLDDNAGTDFNIGYARYKKAGKSTGDAAKHAAKDLSGSIRRDWMGVNRQIMEAILRAKFAPGTDERKALDQTVEYLVEHSNDKYWGNGKDGKGENMLGRLLMRIRGDSNPDRQPPMEYFTWLSQANANIPKCKNCGKNCYANPQGGYFDFCGKTCAGLLRVQATAGTRHHQPVAMGTVPMSTVPMCRSCGKNTCCPNPQGGYFDFCRRQCPTFMTQSSSRPVSIASVSSTPMCKRCHRSPCYVNPQGGYYDFCRRSCTG